MTRFTEKIIKNDGWPLLLAYGKTLKGKGGGPMVVDAEVTATALGRVTR